MIFKKNKKCMPAKTTRMNKTEIKLQFSDNNKVEWNNINLLHAFIAAILQYCTVIH